MCVRVSQSPHITAIISNVLYIVSLVYLHIIFYILALGLLVRLLKKGFFFSGILTDALLSLKPEKHKITVLEFVTYGIYFN